MGSLKDLTPSGSQISPSACLKEYAPASSHKSSAISPRLSLTSEANSSLPRLAKSAAATEPSVSMGESFVFVIDLMVEWDDGCQLLAARAGCLIYVGEAVTSPSLFVNNIAPDERGTRLFSSICNSRLNFLSSSKKGLHA